jgi:hypothetical protein
MSMQDALAHLGFDTWAEFRALADADIASLPLTSRDIDALGLDVDADGVGLLRGADGLLVSWRARPEGQDTSSPDPTAPEAEGE